VGDVWFSISFVALKDISKFLLFYKFPGLKNNLKNCIFFRCMMTIMEEQLYGFYQFPGLKNHWKEIYFLNFLVSRNVFKKGDFCQFLASKIYDKIWHCFNIFSKFCVSENFGISPVLLRGELIF